MHPVSPRQPRRVMFEFEEISPSTTALIVVDMQVMFLEEGQPFVGPHSKSIVPNINLLARTLRAAGGIVVFTRHTVVDEGPGALPDWQRHRMIGDFAHVFRSGAKEHEVDSSLDVQPVDIVIDKYRYDAFLPHSSDIQKRLQAKAIDTVIIAGVVTNACCESTARAASMLGYKTFFISDATAAISDEEHHASLAILATGFADVRPSQSMASLITKT